MDHPLVGMMTKAKASRRLLPDQGLQPEPPRSTYPPLSNYHI